MKVFLSWSGNLSHKTALIFREWLPSVLQYVKPYVSSEDIDKGTRWSTDIAKELEASTYGILCITKDNLDAPWVNFEAGALSKTIEKSKVSPFLLNIKRSEVQGPLLQFQSTILEQEDILKLMIGINKNATEDERLDENRLKKVFEVWYPQLQDQLSKLAQQPPMVNVSKPEEKNNIQNLILEEILELTRRQQKILNSPDILLPPEYIREVIRMANLNDERERMEYELRDPVRFLGEHVELLEEILDTIDMDKGVAVGELERIREEFTKINDVTRHISREINVRVGNSRKRPTFNGSVKALKK